ncbi:MAG: type I restriction-modification enzyme R subunit C-terminal domain-containing protein [Candidatus Dormiibacterota bacterium]
MEGTQPCHDTAAAGKSQVQEIAGLLEGLSTIPMVKEQLVLLEDLQSPEWWEDVTVAMLEQVRKKLRLLVRFIEKSQRSLLYSDFEDEIGPETEYDLIGVVPAVSFERFQAKARAFLRDHQDNIAVHRLRMNKPLTATDLDSLEAMFTDHGIGDAEAIAKAKEENQGLGLFVRSLIGLDRGAAKEAFADFLSGKMMTANQIEFVDMIVNHLTQRGVMGAALLYEAPFTDLAPHGPEDLFSEQEIDQLVGILDSVRAAAA